MSYNGLGIEGMHFDLAGGWLPARMQSLKDGLTIEVHDAAGAVRMLVKTAPTARGALDVEKALKTLGKRLGKGLELDRKPNIPGFRKRLKHLPGLAVFSFRGPDRLAGCGMLAERKTRKEALMCLGFQHTDPDFRSVANAIASFSEDAYDAEQVWEVQGLRLALPAAFHFAGYLYDRRGYMRLVLRDARAELVLERFSGAAMLLAQHGNLARLWLEAAKKETLRFELIKEREISQPHAGFFFRRDTTSSRPKRLKAALRAALPIGRPYFAAGFMWHCEASNRIISLKAAGKRPQDAGIVEQFVDKVTCCDALKDGHEY